MAITVMWARNGQWTEGKMVRMVVGGGLMSYMSRVVQSALTQQCSEALTGTLVECGLTDQRAPQWLSDCQCHSPGQ